MSTTDNPYLGGGAKMIDSFLILITTEFTRTPTRTDTSAKVEGTNNNDGSTQGFVAIGSRIKGGTYGNINGLGGIEGFDPGTGALTATLRPSEASVWKAMGRAMGVDSGTLNNMAGGPIATCLLKNPNL